MAKVTISLDAELVVRDYIARGHRTEARIAERDDALREVDARPRDVES